VDTARAVRKYQREDGAFSTILNQKSYRELSAAALVAAGFLRGVRRGYLPEEFREPGLRALRAVTESTGRDRNGLFMSGISGPTIPLPMFPGLGYRLVPRGRNWSYGLAAALFAAIEYYLLEKQ
jgi:unsaturated rhamnogalacturonyl hydrolase